MYYKINPYFLGKFLKCGSGFERMTISQNGRIRACECFDEKIFDMGDLDDFEKFINGRMNFEKFNSAVVQMYKMCNCKIDNLPCDALREYCFNHIATWLYYQIYVEGSVMLKEFKLKLKKNIFLFDIR